MAIDYRERRTVAKNRPKKQPISTVVVAFAMVIIAAYGLGVATGWLFFRLSPKPVTVAKPANVQLPAPTTQGSAPSPVQAEPGQAAPTQTPPLTFYDTLPKGEKAVMGSGLNPKASTPPPKEQPEQAGPAAKSSPPSAAPAPTPTQPVKPEATRQQQAVAKPASVEKKVSYTVQVASTKDKADAEAIKARMGAQGKNAAYIVVSQVKEKGTWYRVRVGHKLEQAQARDLAAKLGSGAVIVPE